MADRSADAPRVIAFIDLRDLRWQVKRMGGALGQDMTAVLEPLEAGLGKLAPDPDAGLPFGAVYVYSPLETDRPPETCGVIFRLLAGGIDQRCSGCYKVCTHCKAGARDRSGQGRDDPIANDLLELAREDEYDWAVVVSADLRLIPAVRYLQSHGRKIIHGCFPPVAMDLTKECWASIDLGPIFSGLDTSP